MPTQGFNKSSINKTYGDAPFVISASGGESSGAVTYSVTRGGNVVSVDSKGQVTIHNTGTAVITAVKGGDDCYNKMVSTLLINVNKAASFVITPPTATDIPVIGALSTSVLSEGAGSVPGGFSWTNPDQIVSTTGMYEVTFTPEDSMNFTTSTSIIKVQVTPVISHKGTGVILDLSQATLPAHVSSITIALSVEDANNSIFAVLKDLANTDPKYRSNVVAVYDLKLLDQNGIQITDFAGVITVKIPVPDGVSGLLSVLWYDPAAEGVTDMNARLEEGCLIFKTTHFSYYAIVQKELIESSGWIANPDMGDKTVLFVLSTLLIIILIGGLTVLVRAIILKKSK